MKSSGCGLGFLLVVCVLGAGLAIAAPLEEWSLDKRANGIDVYTRPVEGSGIKEFKGTVEVDAEIDAVVALLRDSDRFKTWFPNTPESKLLDRNGDISYQYTVMSTPWPMDDRDNVFRSVTQRDETTGVVEITLTAAPDYRPIQDGRIRVQEARGTWRLEPIANSKTHVTFTMHLEPGGGVPQWIINARIIDTPFQALTNLRKTLTR